MFARPAFPNLILVSVIPILASLGSGIPALGEPAPVVSDEAITIFRRPNHYIVEDHRVENELTTAPLPFLDWGLIQPGFVEYVSKESGSIVPVTDEHPFENPDEIRSAPFAVPFGIVVRGQPATAGGTFVDDFFQPQLPWEDQSDCHPHTLIFDEEAGLYKLWYHTGGQIAYAESTDLKSWRRPLKRYVVYESHPETNLLSVINQEEILAGDLRSVEEARPGIGGAFFVDPSAPPDQRYKCTFLAHVKDQDTAEYARRSGRPISAMTGPGSTVIFGAVSADGIGWRVLPRPIMLHDADTMTVTRYDPLLKQYVMYTRLYELSRRSIARAESADFGEWPLPTSILTAGSEEAPTIDYYSNGFTYYPGQPQIRLIACQAYDRAVDGSELRLATSRDGRTFHFTPHGPAVTADTHDNGGGPFVFVVPTLVRTPDHRMVLLYGQQRNPHKFPRYRFAGNHQYYVAQWPEDRLAAVEARAYGEFTTASLKLRGNQIVLNMRAERSGGIQVELRDESFRPIPGRTFAEADTLSGDEFARPVSWNGKSDVSEYAGQTVYLRFRLREAKLFAMAATD